MSRFRDFTLALACALMWLVSCAAAASADDAKPFAIAQGKFEMTPPAKWVSKTPRTRIVEVEFEAPAAAGDDMPGRVTIMGALGSIEENINRWIGQFSQPDGSATKEKAQIAKFTVGGNEVHWVDIGGTFNDSPPFAGGGVERPDFRMLGAIIVTKTAGNYFVKMTGPESTVAENKDAFRKMLESLKAK